MDLEIFKSIVLGIVQGLTEFFPVSSTAHLILLPWIFDWDGDINTLTFDIALHTGTLLSLLVFFFKDWLTIITKKRKILYFILIATIPAGITGYIFKSLVETTLRSPVIISISLIVFGVYMYVSEIRGSKLKTRKSLDELSLKDSIIIGISQSVALIPGVSRSGITISTGIFRGIKRESSARFSFLMATPIIAGATILEGKYFFQNFSNYDVTLFIMGIITSFISGIFAIKFLLIFFKRFSLNIFIYYRFIISGIIFLMLWIKS